MISLFVVLFVLAGNLLYCMETAFQLDNVSVEYSGGVYYPDEHARINKSQNLIEGLMDVKFFFNNNDAFSKLPDTFFEKDTRYRVSRVRVEGYNNVQTYEGSSANNLVFSPNFTYIIEVYRANRCKVELILDDDKTRLTVNDVEFKTNCLSIDSVSNNTRDLFTAIEEADRKAEEHININLHDYEITEFATANNVECKVPDFFCYLDQENKGDKDATLGLLFNDVINEKCELLSLKLKKRGESVPKVGEAHVKRIVNKKPSEVDKKPSEVDKKPSRTSPNKCCGCC